MNDLIKINFENEGLTLLERQVKTRYNDQFQRMCEYGFSEGTDFYSFLSKISGNGWPSTVLPTS